MVAALMPFSMSASDLTIQEGVVVKFGQGAQLVVRDKLVVGAGVTLTSEKDGAVGALPAAGDWLGVRLEKSSAAYGAMTYNDLAIRYAGAESTGKPGAALTLRGISPVLQYLQITDSTTGLRLLDGASPSIKGSSFLRNAIGLEAMSGSQPTVGSTQFVQNSAQAILNQTPETVIPATGNWWGHSSGPKDAISNPAGQGDVVSAGVNYGGYLAAVPLINPTLRLTSPATYYEQNLVALDLSCVNATEYRVAENGAFNGVAFQPLPSGRISIDYAVSQGDGRKALSAQFRDPSGTTVNTTLGGGVLIDTQPPVVNITNPAAGSLIREPITIEATATDVSGIKQVQFYLGTELLATDTTVPYSYKWNTDVVSGGNYSIRAVAMDEAGRISEHSVSVVVSHGAPVPDTDGPQISNVTANGTPLVNGATFGQPTALQFFASDRSAISRIELLLDGVVKATASGTTNFSATIDFTGVLNGPHTLTLRGVDSLGNISTFDYTINVEHAPPAAPTLSQPINGAVVRDSNLQVSGRTSAGNQVQLHLNGMAVGDVVVADAAGNFIAVIMLVPGENVIQASSADQYGTSVLSSPVRVTLDASVPAPPLNLVANSNNGKIRLGWLVSGDPNVVGYEVYRASTQFANVQEAQRIGQLNKSSNSYEDSPVSDGTYFYRVVSINAAGTASEPTNAASATVDRTPPHAERVEYIANGAYDATSQVYGQGRVDVRVLVSEPLLGSPYLSVVPEGGLPIPVELTRQDDTHYSGSFTLTASAGVGVANVLFSARDLVGNRGDQVLSGETLSIDTRAPRVTAITLDPVAPIDAEAQRQISVRFAFDEDVAGGAPPTAQYQLSGSGRPVVALVLQRQTARQWTSSFELPSDAGATEAEVLSFDVVAEDALGNRGSQLDAPNRFQVYQGELPALDVPVGLHAVAQSGGKVTLEWQGVDGATAYQVYRQAPGEGQFSELARVTASEYLDSTPVDGRYRYAVASVRQHNGSEATSTQSAVAEVDSRRTAPGAPQNLQLSLTSQGVLATWQPPIGVAPASYRLYRAASSTITSVSGLTPIKQGIRQTQVIDAAPSQSEHAYAVTALDAAGNESAISNSAYLNFSLLPVRTLEVSQHGTGLPQLNWTAAGSGATGYDVYVGEGDARLKLTAEPTRALQWVDTGYTGESRYYTIEAVDEHGQRQARGLRLPRVTTQVVSGLPLKRNVMNRLGVQVTNLSPEALASAQVIVAIGTRRFISERFTLATNATRVVPVIVGGYPDMPGSATLSLTLEEVPHEGERISVGVDHQASVVDSTLVVGLETERFVRGATGKVRLSVENTSDVQVELLTARSNGRAPSNELRLKLLDGDGNLLGSTAYQQSTGINVITLANGDTVARIAPGQRYVSDVFEMPVPNASPDQVKLRLEVDALRYNSGEADEVRIPGMGSERSLVLANTPYYGEISSVTPAISFGQQELTVTGRALDRDSGQPVANAPLRIAINQEGFERLASVTSDPQGDFRYMFKPTVTDSGTYQIGAIHPDMTDRPKQAQFTINRVNVSPVGFKVNVPRNYAYRMEFRATTGLGAQAGNVRIAYLPQYQSSGALVTGIRIEPGAPLQIGPRQNLALTASLSGDNTAPASGRLFLAVLADGASEPLAILPVDFTLTEAVPALFATPNYIETGLAQDRTTIERLVLENKGFVAMSDVTLALVNPDGSPAPGWISLASGASLGTLDVGQKQSVDINIAPTAAVAEGIHEFRVRVAAGNLPPQDVNVFVSVTQSGQGSVLFKAADIYTATRDKQGNLIPGVAGARIKLQNEAVISQAYEMDTDVFGEAFFRDLPAGSYRFRASAPNHQEAAGRFVIKPGLTVNQSVFLEYTLISVEWDVREVTIEDRYEITLNATFETDVPAPVVVLQPTSINLPKMAAGEVFQGELILTNYGLVRADDVTASLPSEDSYFKYEFLAQPPTTLEAKQRVRLPYRVIALRDFKQEPVEEPATPVTVQVADSPGMSLLSRGAAASNAISPAAASTSGGGCYTYSNAYRVGCKYECANGTVSKVCGSDARWFWVEGRSCPAGSNPWGSGGGGGGGGGWSSGGGSYSSMPGVPMCAKGTGDCDQPNNKQSGGNQEGGK